MDLIKLKNLELAIKFTPKEFAQLFSNYFLQVVLDKSSKVDLLKADLNEAYLQASKEANSQYYEYYVAFLDIYSIFDNNCNFGFRVKDNFDPKNNKISTIADIKRYTIDPPDIIVFSREDKSYYEFELKRYKEEFTFGKVKAYVEDRIINHYFSVEFNYLIIIQSITGTIDLEVFVKLHQWLISINYSRGQIAVSFNKDNKEMVIVNVYPELYQTLRTWKSGSESFKDLSK